jgi:hypothetical protein
MKEHISQTYKTTGKIVAFMLYKMLEIIKDCGVNSRNHSPNLICLFPLHRNQPVSRLFDVADNCVRVSTTAYIQLIRSFSFFFFQISAQVCFLLVVARTCNVAAEITDCASSTFIVFQILGLTSTLFLF